MIERIKFIVILALTMCTYSSLFLQVSPAIGDFMLNITVIENGVKSPAIVFLHILYPDGFKQVAVAETLSGEVEFRIPIGDLRSAWNKYLERTGTRATPTFLLTAYTRNGYFTVYVFSIEWEEFKPCALGGYRSIILKPKYRLGRKPRISSNRYITSSYPPGPGSELVDSYEKVYRIELIRVKTDGYSRAVASFYYEKYRTLRVTLLVFCSEVGSWDVGGYLGLQSSSKSYKAVESAGNTKHISMKIKHRFEHWVQHIPDENGGWIDVDYYYVYWKGFYPPTLSTERGRMVCARDHRVTQVQGNGYEPGSDPMYTEISVQFTTYGFATDAGWFLQLLESLKKIPENASLATLVFNVQGQYGGYTATVIQLIAWGYKDMTFEIHRMKTVWRSYPVRYWSIFRKQ